MRKQNDTFLHTQILNNSSLIGGNREESQCYQWWWWWGLCVCAYVWIWTVTVQDIKGATPGANMVQWLSHPMWSQHPHGCQCVSSPLHTHECQCVSLLLCFWFTSLLLAHIPRPLPPHVRDIAGAPGSWLQPNPGHFRPLEYNLVVGRSPVSSTLSRTLPFK